MGELSSNRTPGGKGVQIETENEKIYNHELRSLNNLEFGNFTLLFDRVCGKNVPNL